MKIYKIAMRKNTGSIKEVLFTSKAKAVGYIIGRMDAEKEGCRAIEKKTDNWEYDKKTICAIKNWNKFYYIIDGGSTKVTIEEILVL